MQTTFSSQKPLEDTSWIKDDQRIMRLDTKRYDSGVLVYDDLLKNISEETKKHAEAFKKDIFEIGKYPSSMQELQVLLKEGNDKSYYNPNTKKVISIMQF